MSSVRVTSCPRLFADAPSQGPFADDRLEAAEASTLTLGATGFDDDVTELSGGAIRARYMRSVDDDAESNASTDAQRDEVARVGGVTRPFLRHRQGIDVVVDPDGKAETLAQRPREVDVAPPQEMGEVADAAVGVDDARESDRRHRHLGLGNRRRRATPATRPVRSRVWRRSGLPTSDACVSRLATTWASRSQITVVSPSARNLIPTTYPAFGSMLRRTGGRPPLDGASDTSLKMPRLMSLSTMFDTVGALSRDWRARSARDTVPARRTSSMRRLTLRSRSSDREPRRVENPAAGSL